MDATDNDNPYGYAPPGPDPDGIEIALRFLEADPNYPGSDPVKQQLAQNLRHARLSPDQRNRVAALLLRALRHGGDEVFESYARLAPAVTTPVFEAAVTCYAASCQQPVATRAERLLEAIEGAAPMPDRTRQPVRRLQCMGQ